MIYLPSRFLFIHIPRTGGTSIKAALSAAFPEARIDDGGRKHWTAWDFRWNMPSSEWKACYRFTVVRDPKTLIESDWRYCQEYATKTLYGVFATNDLWREKLRRTCDGDFGSFVRNEWLGSYSGLRVGGFRRTWTLGPSGEDIGVHVWRFERLAEDWPAICAAVGLTTPVLLPRLNTSHAEATDWPEKERNAVGEICWMDL